jgi:predicted dehydrogenase
VGSNDVWTLAEEPRVTRQQAIEFGTGELPNFHAYQLHDVIGAIRDKRPPAVTGVDGRRVVAIIQGVYESGRTGRPVKLSE